VTFFRRLTFNLWYLRRPPWDSGIVPPEVEEFIREHPPGKALDLGCGTGTSSLALAQAGWTVTGVDFVRRAIRIARHKARRAGLTIDFQIADVLHLHLFPVSFALILDIGCFHGLSDAERMRMGGQITAVTDPSATMILLCFTPGGRGPLPRGADGTDLMRAFPDWSVTDEGLAETAGMPGPLRQRTPSYYRLRRSSSL
jgi:2-polyprenyl-3-methyl-5-hydroxy-6-metoxy-1,4-benzoquinol methylase